MAKKKNKVITDGNDTRNAIIAIVVILAVIGIAWLVLNYEKFMPAQPDEGIVATVNGDKILKTDVDKRVTYLTAQIGPAATKELALNLSINELLLLQEAKAQGIAADDAAIDKAVNEWLASVKSSMTDEDLNAILKEQNLTMEEFLQDTKDAYRKQSIIYSLINQSVLSKLVIEQPDVNITEDDLEYYYGANKADLVQIKVSHILVCFKDAVRCESNRTKEDAKKVSDTIYQMLLQGQNFADLAMLYSDDPSSKQDGGILDWSAKGTYVPEFEDAAFGLKNKNQYTMPVESPFGFHIIKLDDKKEEFEDLKDSLRFQLMMEQQLASKRYQQEKEQEAIMLYVETLREKADIQIIDPEMGLSKIIPSQPASGTGIKTFSEVSDSAICRTDGKPVVRLYSTTWCPHCEWVAETYDRVAKEYEAAGKIKAYHWELDTGDDTLTAAVENSVPASEKQVFDDFNDRGSIPTFIFGCRYHRIGNGYEAENNLMLEEAEFRAVIEKLLASE